jgi:AcrR family transcriptional regulator
MTEHSHSSSSFRRQPKQQRGKDRVEKILDAAAAVFDRVGYEAATTHMIAAEAKTAIGSIYQFFPDKAAVFNAMELRHIERVKDMWSQFDTSDIAQLSLRQLTHALTVAVSKLFEQPVSRVVFVQFFVSREMFQSIDEGMTQEAIHFMASILQRKNPFLSASQCSLLAEVCVHSSNAVMLSALRSPDPQRKQQLIAQIEDLMVSYLEPYLGDKGVLNVMKVMKCIHCSSEQLSKNGHRRGKQCYRCKVCGKQFLESLL